MPQRKVKFTNNAYGHITAAISPGDQVLQMDDVSLFPSLGTDYYCYVSIDQEVVKVAAIDPATNVMTLDPTDAVQGAHPVNSTVELRMCKELLDVLGDMGEY